MRWLGPLSICCVVVLELDQQAQRIPSFIHYHLSHFILFFSPRILFVVLRESYVEMNSCHLSITQTHTGTYGVSIFTRYCKMHDNKSLNCN